MNRSALECETDAGVPASDKLFRFVVHGVLLNVIGGAGLLGNGLSVLVFSRPQIHSSINCLLVRLAACVTVLVITSVLFFGLTAIYPVESGCRCVWHGMAARKRRSRSERLSRMRPRRSSPSPANICPGWEPIPPPVTPQPTSQPLHQPIIKRSSLASMCRGNERRN